MWYVHVTAPQDVCKLHELQIGSNKQNKTNFYWKNNQFKISQKLETVNNNNTVARFIREINESFNYMNNEHNVSDYKLLNGFSLNAIEGGNIKLCKSIFETKLLKIILKYIHVLMAWSQHLNWWHLVINSPTIMTSTDHYVQ